MLHRNLEASRALGPQVVLVTCQLLPQAECLHVDIQVTVCCFFLQLVTTEGRFLKDSLYNEGILIVWDPSVYHSDIPKVSGYPWEVGMSLLFACRCP